MHHAAECRGVVSRKVLGEAGGFHDPVPVAALEQDGEVYGVLESWVDKVLCIRQSARVVHCGASQP